MSTATLPARSGAHRKHAYVYQSKIDGKIYGSTQVWSAQQAGRINAQNRMDGAFGVWVNSEYLTTKELENVGSPEEAAKHFGSPCRFCGGSGRA